MAKGSRYKVAFRRRREGKTDYRSRFNLIDLDKSRLVIRVSNNHVVVQIINIGDDGDETLVSAHSNELIKLGWLAGTKNTPATYLTGYLCAKKALSNNITDVVVDIGLKQAIKGSKIFAAVKGAYDAGLNVPFGEAIVPEENRINGEHIAEYAKSLDKKELEAKFSQYFANNISPVDLPDHFADMKKKIDEAEV